MPVFVTYIIDDEYSTLKLFIYLNKNYLKFLMLWYILRNGKNKANMRHHNTFTNNKNILPEETLQHGLLWHHPLETIYNA